MCASQCMLGFDLVGCASDAGYSHDIRAPAYSLMEWLFMIPHDDGKATVTIQTTNSVAMLGLALYE